MSEFTIGDRVRIERDATRYPSKGTWPQYRGKIGTITEINADRDRPHLTEYGVIFGNPKTLHRSGVTWFKYYELATVCTRAAQINSDGTKSSPEGEVPLKENDPRQSLR
jgi:hypothetical protein